jgi:tetratricopeptide (TPR) repeat protein
MGKSLPLFLSLLVFAHLSNCQSVAQKPPIDKCGNKHYQDSLIARYIDHGAQNFSYNDPRWTLCCDSLIAICPNIAVAYQQKAVPLIKDGKYEEAFALENKAATLDPRQWIAYRGFLKCIFTKDYEGAILDFQEAGRINSNGREMDHTYPFFEGLSNLELGKYAQAEASFKQDMQLQKGADGKGAVHYNTLFYLGVLYFERKEYVLARQYLEQCLQQYAKHPDANYYLALICRAQGNKEQAARYLATASTAFAAGYRLNEDNIYYANYPRQVTAYEIRQAQR